MAGNLRLPTRQDGWQPTSAYAIKMAGYIEPQIDPTLLSTASRAFVPQVSTSGSDIRGPQVSGSPRRKQLPARIQPPARNQQPRDMGRLSANSSEQDLLSAHHIGRSSAGIVSSICNIDK